MQDTNKTYRIDRLIGTKEYWLAKAAQHEDYIAGLEEGWINCEQFAGPYMTVAEAIEVEKRNVAFCLEQAGRFKTESAVYDYENQAWVVNGRYVRCGHPESMDCGCYGREHAGEVASLEEKQ